MVALARSQEWLCVRRSCSPNNNHCILAMLLAMSTATLVERLSEMREARGLTQDAVASLMGTSQPVVARLEAGGRDPRLSTVERYAAALGVEVVVRDWSSNDQALIGRLADRVRVRLEGADEPATDTFREVVQFVDDATRLSGEALKVAIGREPVSTGDRRWDALLAATASWLAERDGLEVPRWAAAARRVLPAPGWVLTPNKRLHRLVRASTPEAFASRGVYIDAASLESV